MSMNFEIRQQQFQTVQALYQYTNLRREFGIFAPTSVRVYLL